MIDPLVGFGELVDEWKRRGQAAHADLLRRTAMRLPDMRARAMGRMLSVRLDRKTTLCGEVIDVAIHGVRETSTALTVVFAVQLECGSAKVHRTVHVTKLPR